MSQHLDIVEPGDRPNFIEGWHESAMTLGIDWELLATQSLGYLLELAWQAVDELGESYRGFRVGCAVVALDQMGGRIGHYFHGNFTPYKGADWNCAEKRAFEKVTERGFDTILAVGIVGPIQTDEVSGVESPTLHPCYRCRGMFEESSLTDPDTLIATMNLEENAYELHTEESMLALHRTGSTQPFPTTHPLLAAYWRSLVSFDRHAEKEEIGMLERIEQMQGRS